MIAFGGSIGTGLFIGSGGALSSGGPGFLLIGFILIGIMLFSVVMALGELASNYPVAGSFAAYSTRFIDPSWWVARSERRHLEPFFLPPFLTLTHHILSSAFTNRGFAMGWNYWAQWLIVLPLELTAASIVINYWDPNEVVPPGVWVAVFLILLTWVDRKARAPRFDLAKKFALLG